MARLVARNRKTRFMNQVLRVGDSVAPPVRGAGAWRFKYLRAGGAW